MNDDHLYGNPEYSWDEYVQAWRFEESAILISGVQDRSV